jgi:hypothetical protein
LRVLGILLALITARAHAGKKVTFREEKKGDIPNAIQIVHNAAPWRAL